MIQSWNEGTAKTLAQRSRNQVGVTPIEAKGRVLSFRPNGETFLKSLAFAWDDGPRPLI
jgi:hypothetical protein